MAERDGRATADELEAAFERHRRELHVHCYRMTGSYWDAEDLLQETYLRAWRNLARFERRSSLRTWLYTIATNASIDLLKRRDRGTRPSGTVADILEHDDQLQPYPDHRPALDDPADAAISRHAVELYFVAALTVLPTRQRAVLIARDVLDWPATEAAELIGASVAATNSLLQRARSTMRDVMTDTPQAPSRPTDDQAVLRSYVDAHERGDAATIVAMLHDDVRITMPPERGLAGVGEAAAFFREILGDHGPGEWRLVPVWANGRPAAANYLRVPGERAFRALTIDLLQVDEGRLTGINCFLRSDLVTAFGLPTELT